MLKAAGVRLLHETNIFKKRVEVRLIIAARGMDGVVAVSVRLSTEAVLPLCARAQKVVSARVVIF